MRCHRFVLVAIGAQLLATLAGADELDDFIVQQMQRRAIPGLSIAIVDGGKIVRAKAYGVVETGTTAAVTPATLFLAGSISKPVTAAAALTLVDRTTLKLDEDVNAKLTSWKVPDNEFNAKRKVTLADILTHSSGLSGPFFDGYAASAPLPTLLQVLDGKPPAISKPIRVEFVPGSDWRYSGGAYLVLQQLLVDVSGRPFPDLMRDVVLKPLAMMSSTFEQPLRRDRGALAATGHLEDRSKVPGRWHVYPEMAAGGLWTTSGDLARFAIGMQQSMAGAPNSLLSKALARQMVTPHRKDDDGLGWFVEGKGDGLRFFYYGRDEGFDSALLGFVETGKGAVVMLNANDDSRMVQRIFGRLAALYHWPGFPTAPQRSDPVALLEPAVLAKYEGRYEFAPQQGPTFAARDGRLFTQRGGRDDEEFVPVSELRFVSTERDTEFTFTLGPDGAVTGLLYKNNGVERTVRRVAR
jgi:CubicO group peptidase (beta-lactamase class C family)